MLLAVLLVVAGCAAPVASPANLADAKRDVTAYVESGRYDADQLAQLIRRLPEGTTEFMCHPGFCTGELRGAPTRLKESRRQELDALTSLAVRTALKDANVILGNYRKLQ